MRRTSASGGSCPTQGCTFPGWHERGQRHAPPTTLAWHSVIRDTNGSFCPESPTRRAADEVAPTSISGRDTGHQYCQHPESGRLEGVKRLSKGHRLPAFPLQPLLSALGPAPSPPAPSSTRPRDISLSASYVSLLSPPPATALCLPADSGSVSAFL